MHLILETRRYDVTWHNPVNMFWSWANAGSVLDQLWANSWWSHDIDTLSTSWWRHQMETFSALLALCAGNSPVTGEFPAQRPVTRSFDVFFDLCLNNMNKRLSKDSWGWWFEMPSHSLWRHCNVIGPLWRESTGHSSGGLSLRRVSNTDLWCFLWCFPWC